MIHPSTSVKFALFLLIYRSIYWIWLEKNWFKWNFLSENKVPNVELKNPILKCLPVPSSNCVHCCSHKPLPTNRSHFHVLLGNFSGKIPGWRLLLEILVWFTNIDRCMMPWRRSRGRSCELKIYMYRLHEVLSHFKQYRSVSVCVAVVTISA